MTCVHTAALPTRKRDVMSKQITPPATPEATHSDDSAPRAGLASPGYPSKWCIGDKVAERKRLWLMGVIVEVFTNGAKVRVLFHDVPEWLGQDSRPLRVVSSKYLVPMG